jgi:hypothetical protein
MVQVCSDPTNTSHIDNIRLAIHNETSGILYDLDGKVMYDLNNLPVDDTKDEIDKSEFDNIDYDAKNEEISKNKKTDVNADEAKREKSFIAKYFVWIIVGGGVLLLIVAAVVVIIIISAKKKKAATETESNEETDGEPSQSTEK